ncbi:hypothetical protein EXM22_12055 [Oceanispirochaeta crateris]|uniref:Uncharacterized protein n=1 Tax=Oceanispirochaeta crateris TaxID=2518645 RepID=A0A5C1QKK7_9SPIO|nr:hypothetical protein [Oceanispirochaeta crateris]QEN08685.1 hypothetical protein EXM22_12055 [Oceanispirochaeta crateris]
MKNLKHLSLFLMVLLVMTGFMSCELIGKDDIAIIGEWDTTSDSGSGRIIFTDSSYENYYNGELSYTAKIVHSDNYNWNGEESGEGYYGYLVIQFDNPPSWNTTIENKFVVLRWKNFIEGTSMDYSEGYLEYFDTADEAIEGATAANGFFGTYTTVSKL